jgi:hypothetical protein
MSAIISYLPITTPITFPSRSKMDPLSVAASIVGILAAAGKISELLHCVVSSAKDAPHVVTALAFEVDDVRTAVSALQGLLMHHLISAPSRRTKLIQLDRLIVTLTEMVLTFSELETAVSPMVVPEGGKTPLKTRLRWPRIESDCSKMVEKLQRHKASVSLMLNILQWYVTLLARISVYLANEFSQRIGCGSYSIAGAPRSSCRNASTE